MGCYSAGKRDTLQMHTTCVELSGVMLAAKKVIWYTFPSTQHPQNDRKGEKIVVARGKTGGVRVV